MCLVVFRCCAVSALCTRIYEVLRDSDAGFLRTGTHSFIIYLFIYLFIYCDNPHPLLPSTLSFESQTYNFRAFFCMLVLHDNDDPSTSVNIVWCCGVFQLLVVYFFVGVRFSGIWNVELRSVGVGTKRRR